MAQLVISLFKKGYAQAPGEGPWPHLPAPLVWGSILDGSLLISEPQSAPLFSMVLAETIHVFPSRDGQTASHTLICWGRGLEEDPG